LLLPGRKEGINPHNLRQQPQFFFSKVQHFKTGKKVLKVPNKQTITTRKTRLKILPVLFLLKRAMD
jgi:hypothetical protein